MLMTNCTATYLWTLLYVEHLPLWRVGLNWECQQQKWQDLKQTILSPLFVRIFSLHCLTHYSLSSVCQIILSSVCQTVISPWFVRLFPLHHLSEGWRGCLLRSEILSERVLNYVHERARYGDGGSPKVHVHVVHQRQQTKILQSTPLQLIVPQRAKY